jgi:lipopolysaccharide export system permease protein
MFGLLQRYVTASVLRSLIFTWLVLNAVVVSLLFGDKWDNLLENDATTKQALTYFVCILPQATLLVFPAVCQMGALFGVLALARYQELSAMFAAGASLRWLIRPTIVLSLLLSAACFAWNEYVAAPLSRQGEQLMITEIQKKKGIFKDYGLVRGTKNRFIRYGSFDREDGILTDFVLHEMMPAGRGHKRFIRAAWAAWDPALYNEESKVQGAWRLYSAAGKESYVMEIFDDWRTSVRPLQPEGEEILRLDETPDDIGIDERQPYEMGYGELKKRIADLEAASGSVLSLYTDLDFKLAFPFSTVALMIIGFVSGASSFLMGREGAARFTYPLGVCLMVMMLYYGSVGLCLALGYSLILPSWASAWLPNILFGGLSVWMLAKA